MCYVIKPQTHKWYKINANGILKNYKLALCDDQSAQMVPPAELPAINAFMTIVLLNIITSPKWTN